MKATSLALLLFVQPLLHGADSPSFTIELRRGKLVIFEASDTTYRQVLPIVAALSGKLIRIESAPEEPLFVTYRDRTPDEAFQALMRSSALSVSHRGGVYVIRAKKP